MRKFILAAVLVGGLAGIGLAADPLDTWYWRNPTPQGNELNGVCFGADEFVAVGANGTVLTSPDGESWLNQTANTRLDLRGVTHGGGRYVAVGDFGLILYSDDARTWQAADSPWFYHLNAVTWGNGLFVAVGEDTAVLTSPDGVTWTLRGTGSEPLWAVAFGGGVYLAGGGNPPPKVFNQPVPPVSQILLRSTDGTNWSAVSPGIEGAVTAIGRGLGTFVLALAQRQNSFLLDSSDGLSWFPSFSFTAYGMQVSAITGDGISLRAVLESAPYNTHQTLMSMNGYTWSFDASALISSRHALAAGAGRFVSVGSSLDYNDPGLEGIVIRTSAGQWKSVSVAQKTPGRMVFGDNRTVGLYTLWDTNGAIVATYAANTTNGTSWKSHPVVPDVNLPPLNLTFGNGRFLAWGDNGVLAHSVDASVWTVTTNVFDPPIYFSGETLLAGNGVYLWLHTGETSFLSTNLTTWEAVTTPTIVPPYPNREAALFGNGWFVLRDDGNGGIQRSLDGRNWAFQAVADLPDLLGFYQDRFLGWRNGLYQSSDAIHWAKVGSSPEIESFFDAIYSDGLYLIYGIGWSQTSPGLVVVTRDEGVTWTTHQLTWDQPFWSAIIAYNSVLFSGSYGALIQSAPLSVEAPRFLEPLSSAAVQPGTPYGLLGKTIGSLPMSFEWYRDGVLIPNATEPLLSLPDLVEGESHAYSLIASNALGSVTNGPARVTVGRQAFLGIDGGPSVSGFLAGTAGLTYRVEFRDGSPAEGSWQTLTNLTLVGPSGAFVDAPPTNRFYRAELVP